MKNILRKRNSSTPAKLPRGLSQKALDVPDSALSLIKSPTRTFLLETPVQFTTVRLLPRLNFNLTFSTKILLTAEILSLKIRFF